MAIINDIQISLTVSNTNSALMVMMLWEMLEHPDIVQNNLSNLCQPAGYDTLVCEVLSWRPYMEQIRRDNQPQATPSV